MSNLQQFYNLSTWRKETVNISPHEVEVVDFIDTNPNMFYIINPNLATLKVGIGSIPRSNSYEFKVESNSSEIVGRPEGSTKLYILNDSSIEVNLTVFSVNKEFDPAILKNTNVVIDGYDIHTGSEITGVMEGVVLPTEDKYSSEMNSVIKQILTLLNATGVTEYNSAAILNTLKTIYGATSLDSLLSKLSEIATNTEKIELTAENVTAIAYDDTELKELISKMVKSICGDENYTPLKLYQELEIIREYLLSSSVVKPKVEHYENNAVEFTYTAEYDQRIHFDWLLNDGGFTNVIVDGQYVLSIFEGERFTDIEFTLYEGQSITLQSEEPMWRIKYYVKDLPSEF